MELDATFCERIAAIDWFTQCGRGALPGDYRWADSWEGCSRSLESPEWEDTTLEASNDLSAFLNGSFPKEYQRWNDYAELAREFLEKDVRPKLGQVASRYPLSSVFQDCVMWDMLHAIIENEYREQAPDKKFFLGLLELYEAGRFPCGWVDGRLPAGTLVVF